MGVGEAAAAGPRVGDVGAGLEINIPLIGYFSVSLQPGRGIELEVLVGVTQSGLARRIDAPRSVAWRLASGG